MATFAVDDKIYYSEFNGRTNDDYVIQGDPGVIVDIREDSTGVAYLVMITRSPIEVSYILSAKENELTARS